MNSLYKWWLERKLLKMGICPIHRIDMSKQDRKRTRICRSCEDELLKIKEIKRERAIDEVIQALQCM